MTEATGRVAGFYWLRDEDGWTIGKFETGELINYHNGWWICGSDVPYRDNDFIEIDETPITRPGVLEKVAIAMWRGVNPHKSAAEMGPWEDHPEESKKYWRLAARAATQALMEPTEEMKAAVTTAAWRSGPGVDPAIVCQAMLKAMLNEKTE